MAEAICQMVENVSAGTSMADGISAVAASGDIFTVADGISNKLYVAYAAYTG
jgi:hypothetical protein